MKDELIEILHSIGYEVYLEGTLTDDVKYHHSYFVYWNYQTTNGKYYDNKPTSTTWDFWVYFYSVDPDLVNTVLSQAGEKLAEAGWIVEDNGEDAPSYEPSHTGRMLSCRFMKHY